MPLSTAHFRISSDFARTQSVSSAVHDLMLWTMLHTFGSMSSTLVTGPWLG